MNKKIRKPAVAGTFYSGDKSALMEELDGYISGEASGKPDETVVDDEAKIFGSVCPHAGYYYSGHVAGATLSRVEVPDKVILLGPNHRGIGSPAAISDADGWEFPFGVVPVDGELSQKLSEESGNLKFDSSAHAREHSLEVIVPFLYARNRNVSIAAIALSALDDSAIREITDAVAKVAGSEGALIVASSDMTHYKPDGEVRKIDSESIKLIEKLDEKGLMEKVLRDGSMCGVWAVSVAIAACRQNGATHAKLARYATSGDIGNERESVVGYAGFTICG